jgi:hypothetical protein
LYHSARLYLEFVTLNDMDALHDDLFQNKYFRIILVVFGVIGLGIYLVDYVSVESKCERYYEKVGSVFSTGSELRELQIDSAMSSSIEDCIDRGGPSRD